jgi:hypothetical protein
MVATLQILSSKYSAYLMVKFLTLQDREALYFGDLLGRQKVKGACQFGNLKNQLNFSKDLV